jgi:hypothetical protein
LDTNNTVLTLGKEWIAQRCTGEMSTLVTHLAVGTSSTAVVVGDTSLKAENARVALNAAGAVKPANKNVMRYEATFNAGVGTGALTEAGLFTASTAGTCIARTVFAVKNKGVDDVFTVVWEITIN